MKPTHQDIDAYLASIEHEYEIKIIASWNTGSHSWGLANEGSDWDIQIIYTQPLTQYATNAFYLESIKGEGTELETLTERTDIDPELAEFEGWDARRFLQLAAENNPSIMEALNAPIAYRTHPIIEQIRAYMNDHFNAIELFNHYQSFTKKMYKKYIRDGDDRTIKRNLYTARAALYAEHIRDTREFPSLDFERFIEEEASDDLLDRWDIDTIEMFIEEKRAGNDDREIGNPLAEQFESLAEYEITDHRALLREAHEFDEHERERYSSCQHQDIDPAEFPPGGYTCHPPLCNGHTDSNQLDIYMRRLLRSRTLFQ